MGVEELKYALERGYGGGSPWAREALEGGEITQAQYDWAVENGAKIMQAKPKPPPSQDEWRPAPEGPPPSHQAQGRYIELRRWCKDHPGDWSVIEESHTTIVQRFKHDGFEAVGRNTRMIGGVKRIDVYVRWPAPKGAK